MVDWIQTLPGTSPYVCLVFAGLLVLFAIAAFVWIAVPGGLTRRERRLAVKPNNSVLPYLTTLVPPIALVFGAVTLFFPISAPQCIVLSSRSRLTSDSTWSDEWRAQLDGAITDYSQEFGRPSRIVDVGPLVDEICHEIVSQVPVLNHKDPASVAAIASVVRDHLIDRTPSLTSVQHSDVSLSSLDLLPAWVVQSVEITILRVLMSQSNVSLCVARFPDFTDGMYPWETLNNLLERDAPRWRPPTIVLEHPRQSADFQLYAVLATRWDGHQTAELDCLFYTASPISKSVTLTLESNRDDPLKSAPAQVASSRPGFFVNTTPFTFTPVAPSFDWDTAVAFEHRSMQRIVPSDPKRLGMIKVAFKTTGGASPSTWESMLLTLQNDTSAPQLEEWRSHIQSMGFDIERVVVTGESDADVFVCSDGMMVTVGKSDTVVNSSAVAAYSAPIRTRVSRTGTPGVYSLDGLPWKHNVSISEVDPAASAAQWTFDGSADYLSTSLTGGTVPTRPAPDARSSYHVLATGKQTLGDRSYPLVFIGTDFEEQGILLDDPRQLNETTFAAWTALLQAIYQVRSSALPSFSDNSPLIHVQPFVLLTEDELETLNSRALAANILWFALGILFFAIFVTRYASQNARSRS